ncbi:MAG: hypothetical protein Q7U88_12095 [Desulfocapsaceae bacterium]|nr:hypothetical protein [Desulfocapsaceae bacterium]
MRCQYLSCYTSVNNSWSVASCSFKRRPYVPSLQEIENYCTTGKYQHCPLFFQNIPPLMDKCFWPELEVVALAQCR